MNPLNPSEGKPIPTTYQNDQWDAMFGRLVEFKALHGHSMVPQNYTGDRQLELWVNAQCENWKDLFPEQLRRLEQLGFSWIPITNPSETWDAMFDRLVKYRLAHGNCIVPQYYNSKDPQLCNWIETQRSNENMLMSTQKQKLDSIGFVWSAHKKRSREELWDQANEWLTSTWLNDGMGKISETHKKMKLQGGENVSSEEDTSTKVHKKTDKQVQPLQSAMSKRSDSYAQKNRKRWLEMHSRLKDYKEKHKDCMVPGRYKIDPQLGTWVSQQRQIKDEIADDRKKLLDELGFVWTVRRIDTWDSMYGRLARYKMKHGNCLVPLVYQEDPKLASWVHLQRRERLKMSKEHRQRLDHINFCWNNAKEINSTRETTSVPIASLTSRPVSVETQQGTKAGRFMPLAPRPPSCSHPPSVPQKSTDNAAMGSSSNRSSTAASGIDILPLRPWHSKSYKQSVKAHKTLHANIIFGALQGLEVSQKVQNSPLPIPPTQTRKETYSKPAIIFPPNPMPAAAPILRKPPSKANEATLAPRVNLHQPIAPRPVIMASRPDKKMEVLKHLQHSVALQNILPKPEAQRAIFPLPDIQPANTQLHVTKQKVPITPQPRNAKCIQQHKVSSDLSTHLSPPVTSPKPSATPDKIESYSNAPDALMPKIKKPKRCDEIPVKDLSMLLVWGECETTRNKKESGEAKLVGVISNAQPNGAKYGEVDVALFFVSNAGFLAEPLVQRIRSRYLFRVEMDSEEAMIAKEWNDQREHMSQT